MLPLICAVVAQQTGTLRFDDVRAGNYVVGSPVAEGARLSTKYLASHGVVVTSTAGYTAIVELDRGLSTRHAPSSPNGIQGTTADGKVSSSPGDPIDFEFFVPGPSRAPATINRFEIRQDLLGGDNSAPVAIRAFDIEGNLVASQSFPDVSGSKMTVSAKGIHRVRVISNGSTGFDDVSFSTPKRASLRNSCVRFTSDGQVALAPYRKDMDSPEVTVEAWIKPDPTSVQRFYNYVICRNYGDLGWGLAIHGSPVKVFSQAPDVQVPIGEWTHIAVSCSRERGKFYVNGRLANSWPRSGPLKTFAHDLMIGNSDFSGEPGHQPTGFRGSIDEVRVWEKARTQAQIRSTMNRRLGRQHGLLAYYGFDEGSGDAARDSVGRFGSAMLQGPDPSNLPLWSEGPRLIRSR